MLYRGNLASFLLVILGHRWPVVKRGTYAGGREQQEYLWGIDNSVSTYAGGENNMSACGVSITA